MFFIFDNSLFFVIQVPNSLEFPQISFCNHRYLDLANAIQIQLDEVEMPKTFKKFGHYNYAIKRIIDLMRDLGDYSNDSFPSDVYQWQRNFSREIMSRPLTATFLTNNNSTDEPGYDDISTMHEPFIMTCLHGTRECKLDHLIKYRDPNFLVCYRYDPNKEYGKDNSKKMNVSQGVANGISMVLLTGVGMLNAEKLKTGEPKLGGFSQTAQAASPTTGADGVRVMIHQSGTIFFLTNAKWILFLCQGSGHPGHPGPCQGSQELDPRLQEKSMNPFCISFGKDCMSAKLTLTNIITKEAVCTKKTAHFLELLPAFLQG